MVSLFYFFNVTKESIAEDIDLNIKYAISQIISLRL